MNTVPKAWHTFILYYDDDLSLFSEIPDKSPDVHPDKFDMDRLRDDESWDDEWAGLSPEEITKVLLFYACSLISSSSSSFFFSSSIYEREVSAMICVSQQKLIDDEGKGCQDPCDCVGDAW
jgi:hypothetical protein